MPLAPGLNPNIRLVTDNSRIGGLAGRRGIIPGSDDEVDVEDAPDQPQFTGDKLLEITHGDGSVTISLDGRSLDGSDDDLSPPGWFDNLAPRIPEARLNAIADQLLRGIEDDIQSRRDWVETRKLGMELLGLKVEPPVTVSPDQGAGVEGMSRVRHPILMEAVLRFQANARSEMLPTDGPVKIRDDSDSGTDWNGISLANALETDLNHYLTVRATEYYPDTDRMLLMLGFGGTSFKKVYNCPLRRRPVSETVDSDDLIVSNTATDLGNAIRITHRISLRPSVVRRMQLIGAWRDIPLSDPNAPELDSVQREKADQQGIDPEPTNPIDRNRELYECYCELDIAGFEHRYKGKPSGLEVPYRVTIDVTSQQVLAISRNYHKPDPDELPEARQVFVQYTFVPGFGLYGIGLLNILGNTTSALTAAWREMLDNGMFANFPGFLVAKSGSRQQTNIFRVPPGGGVQIDTAGQPINQAVMPLPYRTEGMAALMALVQDIAMTGMRIGGTSETQVGEGRADAPVGTTLAMIDQAEKVMNAVHKRMHASQAREFQLLKDCFKENPEAFFAKKCKSKTAWNKQALLQALDLCELVPQADPNTASHSARMMKIVGLVQLQQQNQALFDPLSVVKVAIQALGWNNPEQFLAPPQAQAAPPPELLEMQAKAKVDAEKADAAMLTAKAKLIEAGGKGAAGHAKAEESRAKAAGLAGGEPGPDPVDMIKAKTGMMDAETRRFGAQTNARQLALKGAEVKVEDENRDLDRHSREKLAVMQLARTIMQRPESTAAGAKAVKPVEKEIGVSGPDQ